MQNTRQFDIDIIKRIIIKKTNERNKLTSNINTDEDSSNYLIKIKEIDETISHLSDAEQQISIKLNTSM